LIHSEKISAMLLEPEAIHVLAKHLSRKQPLIIPIPSRGYGKLSTKETLEKTEGT
jgi:hypothetical protein